MTRPEYSTTFNFGAGSQKAIGFTLLDPADSTRCNSNQAAFGPSALSLSECRVSPSMVALARTTFPYRLTLMRLARMARSRRRSNRFTQYRPTITPASMGPGKVRTPEFQEES